MTATETFSSKIHELRTSQFPSATLQGGPEGREQAFGFTVFVGRK